jgi:plasmid rolling circle replication initiator protein Rep
LLKLYYKFNFATEPEGLYRKRLISYGGLLKEIHKELNLDDAEDGDLIHTDDEEKKQMKMAFLLLQCGIGSNGKIILLKSNSTKGPRLFKQNKTS